MYICTRICVCIPKNMVSSSKPYISIMTSVSIPFDPVMVTSQFGQAQLETLRSSEKTLQAEPGAGSREQMWAGGRLHGTVK